MEPATRDFAGVPVRSTTLSAAAQELLETGTSHERPTAYRLVNSYTFALADRMPSYHKLLQQPGVNLPDGRPLVQSLNALTSGAAFHQVRGPSLFIECLDRGRQRKVRHFFLGGTQETLDAMVTEAQRVVPGVIICGTHSPPFRELTDDEREAQDRLVQAAKPDIVWVGLGTPRQDFEAHRLTERLGITTAGVGAAFGFLAGTQREAPPWVRAISMEWFFRLVTEPRRLWRRYLFGNTRFLYLVVRAGLRPHRQSTSTPRARR